MRAHAYADAHMRSAPSALTNNVAVRKCPQFGAAYSTRIICQNAASIIFSRFAKKRSKWDLGAAMFFFGKCNNVASSRIITPSLWRYFVYKQTYNTSSTQVNAKYAHILYQCLKFSTEYNLNMWGEGFFFLLLGEGNRNIECIEACFGNSR